ncbi:Centromere-associated protein E [Frankliniella fusca]|uniref:Centromere-associated protein E n=1 Tax=Frankliniella fusca TaxID=407009 RepID=A0AAE1HRV7_9NEOP|nr:Centromere-associated protein E [Frankliniella fusca]
MKSQRPVLQLLSANKPLESPSKRVKYLDWSKCILCQETKSQEGVIDPSKGKNGNNDQGYISLASSLEQFEKLKFVPLNVDVALLRGDGTLIKRFQENHAVYHKSCYLCFSKSKLDRAQKKKNLASSDQENVSPSTPVTTRGRCSAISPYQEETCIFCDLPASRMQPLSAVMTESSETIIKEAAASLQDDKILLLSATKKLVGSAKYHNKCRSAFINRVRPKCVDHEINDMNEQIHGIVLSGLVSYLHEIRAESETPPCWKMAELGRLYAAKLADMGVNYEVHSTRLRERLLLECPDLESSGTTGQDILIAFKKDIDFTLRESARRNFDEEGYILSRAADIVRRDIFLQSNASEVGAARSVPVSLKSLVQMICHGNGLTDQQNSTAVSSIADLLAFHAVKRTKAGKSHKHFKWQETPTPVHVATKIYGDTRKKKLIDVFCDLGLSISYDRLQAILDEKAQKTALQFLHEGVVAPADLKMKSFMFPFPESPGEDRCLVASSDAELKKKAARFELPADYTTTGKLRFLDPKQGFPPYLPLTTTNEPATSSFDLEKSWLENCLDSETCKTWPDFHSGEDVRRPQSEDFKTRVSVLPVFHEQAHSMDMMAHSMSVVAAATRHLNPEQTPVIVVDQPLYALCKSFQWQDTDLTEKNIFVMLGGMHIELVSLRVAGQWLDGSGWTSALVEAGVTTQGRADATIKASHLTRSRYAHQVTAAALYKLQRAAYEEYSGDDPLSFEEWCQETRQKSIQFRFWDIALALELCVLVFVRAIRTADFGLYKAALKMLVPWMFALDHVNYARWLPVHIRDLVNLEHTHPALYQHFQDGRFVARLTEKKFSAIALDQAHEQQNARLKGDGGMIGLTENPVALRKWMLGTPALAKMNEDFECTYRGPKPSDDRHHLSTNAATETFRRDVSSLYAVMAQMGNPFLDNSNELYNIDSKTVASSRVVETVKNIEEVGISQYITFAEQRFQPTSGITVHDKIKMNNMALFSSSTRQEAPSKAKGQLKSLKENCTLFGHLYVTASNNTTTHDLDDFFAHENQEFPPSISLFGSFRTTNKADIYRLLMSGIEVDVGGRGPQVDAKILDGAAIIQMLRPGVSVSIEEYIQSVFLKFIKSEACTVSRLDVVWDTYLADSLKSMTREKRGKGLRVRVTLNTKLPKGWDSFLRDSDNKTELFQLISEAVRALHIDGKTICATQGQGVYYSPPRSDASMLSPCNHEEADTRVFLHAVDAARDGCRKIMIRTSDSDLVVIGVSGFHRLADVEELWIHLKAGKNNNFIPIHQLVSSLGPAKSMAMIGFHAFTGCDTVSSFHNHGKSKAMLALEAYPVCLDAFVALSNGNLEEAFPVLQNFVIKLYSPSRMYENLVACRRALFTKYSRQIDDLPPTIDSLLQHTRRAALQAQIWRQAFQTKQILPLATDWGWTQENGKWVPVWRTIPVAAESCNAFVRCKCKLACSGNCSCRKKGIKCRELCSCKCA